MVEKMHEIVIPTDPLPVWYYVLHGVEGKHYVAPHWHRGIELNYMVRGTIQDFMIGKKHYSSYPGKILIVNTQEIHSVRSITYNNDLSLSLIFPYDYVVRLYPPIKRKKIIINDCKQFSEIQKLSYSKLQALLTEFIELSLNNSEFRWLEQHEIIDKVLKIILRDFTCIKDEEGDINQRKSYVINRLQFITQYVNNHYQEEISLTSIAEQLHLSKEYLARFFKKEMEMTIDTYIDNVRAEHAHSNLMASPSTLTAVAIKNGFSEVRKMNRAFERLYGESASQFKRRINKK